MCAGSTGAVPTTPVAAEVVCAPGCMVQVAGVPGNSCDGRPRGAPFAASSSVYPPAGGISTYVGQRKSIPALVRDAYGWAVALPTPYVLHVALVNSNGLLTFDSSSVLPGTNVGEYTVYFSAPQADLFSLHVTIDVAEVIQRLCFFCFFSFFFLALKSRASSFLPARWIPDRGASEHRRCREREFVVAVDISGYRGRVGRGAGGGVAVATLREAARLCATRRQLVQVVPLRRGRFPDRDGFC